MYFILIGLLARALFVQVNGFLAGAWDLWLAASANVHGPRDILGWLRLI